VARSRALVSLRVGLGLLLLSWPALAVGVEFRLRESLLEAQRNRVTITIAATVGHIGETAHPLDASKPLSGDDRDLHVPLRSKDIRVPILGEVKNPCSMKPAGQGLGYWSNRVDEDTADFGECASQVLEGETKSN
jgi:hypothetical protein